MALLELAGQQRGPLLPLLLLGRHETRWVMLVPLMLLVLLRPASPGRLLCMGLWRPWLVLRGACSAAQDSTMHVSCQTSPVEQQDETLQSLPVQAQQSTAQYHPERLAWVAPSGGGWSRRAALRRGRRLRQIIVEAPAGGRFCNIIVSRKSTAQVIMQAVDRTSRAFKVDVASWREGSHT